MSDLSIYNTELIEEVISLLWPICEYAEDDPQSYREFNEQEVQMMQLTLLKVIEMLRTLIEDTKES